MEGLDHCHKNGWCHRDIKPENLLLDSNFDLKIADFGFVAPVGGRDGSGLLKTICGTPGYMATEIWLKIPYEGKKVDIFASGVILFMSLT